MYFNSLEFLFFFIAFFIFYWKVFNKNVVVQNVFLLAASYFFYAFWDWHFLLILIVNSALNFFVGKSLGQTKNSKKRRLLVYLTIFQGIGCLIYFKYFNFFIISFVDAFEFFQIHLNVQTLNIILPVGISYYTFRTISYVLDVDKGKIEPTTNWIVFFNYVAFFPSLLSGPIDKAKLLVPQIESKRKFLKDDSVEGLRQILWGLFKKLVIADNCAVITSQIFDSNLDVSASMLLLGAFLYAILIYADFSGYSDMAIGVARMLGFKTTKNFDFPFFATNIVSFWRKWHISLTAWVTEYVYTPLAINFRNLGKFGLILAVVINLTIVGVWHGASWNFILFGFVHGCFFIPVVLSGKRYKNATVAKGKLIPTVKEFFNMISLFVLIMMSFIIFRTNSIAQAVEYYSNLFSSSIFSIPVFDNPKTNALLLIVLVLISFLIIAEWLGREVDFALSRLEKKWPKSIRWIIYILILFLIGMYSHTEESQFIYFNF